MDRFFAPQAGDVPEVSLPADEAHHARNVLRKRPGDTIELFDGAGRSAAGEILRCEKRETVVQRLEAWRFEPLPPRRLVLATVLPKGDRARFLVEKATELGVHRLVPLRTRRSVVDPGESKVDRLRAAVVAACKQSGRNWLMDVADPLDWADLASAPPEHWMIADRDGTAFPSTQFAGECTIAIGPEGGFTDDELDSARAAGAAFVSLAPHVLRIETAAVAAAAVFAAWTRADPM